MSFSHIQVWLGQSGMSIPDQTADDPDHRRNMDQAIQLMLDAETNYRYPRFGGARAFLRDVRLRVPLVKLDERQAQGLAELLVHEPKDSPLGLLFHSEKADEIVAASHLLGPAERELVRQADLAISLPLGFLSAPQKIELIDALDYPKPDALGLLLGVAKVNIDLVSAWANSWDQDAIDSAIERSFANYFSWDPLIGRGETIPPRIRRGMLDWARRSTDLAQVRQLMERRFALSIKADVDWEKDGLVAAWEQFDKLPVAHVSASAFFTTLKRVALPNPNDPIYGNTPFLGSTPWGEVQIAYQDPEVEDVNEVYTRRGHILHGVGMVKSTVAHEVGHTVDRHRFSDVDKDLRNLPFLGAWTIHADNDALLDTILDEGHFAAPSGHRRAEILQALEHGTLLNLAPGDDPKLIEFINDGRKRAKPITQGENRELADGRYYYQAHQGYLGRWLSYDSSIRNGLQLSYYAYETPMEFFAELYAAFYTSDPPGKAIREWNPEAYLWFLDKVDRGYSR